MRRSYLLYGACLMVAAVIWAKRNQELRSLQREMSEVSSHQPGPASAPAGSQSASSSRGVTPLYGQPLSTAGESLLPEARRILEDYHRLDINETSSGLPPDPPEKRERLIELLTQMGAATLGQLIDSYHRDFPNSLIDLRAASSVANPREFFLLESARLKDGTVDNTLLGAFDGWAFSDPTAAFRWHQEALEAGDSSAASQNLRAAALYAEARIDPSRSLSRLIDLIQEQPGDFVPSEAGNLAGNLQDTAERISFMTALNALRNDPDRAGMLEEMHTATLMNINRTLMWDSFREAAAVVDASYTPDQRREFATVCSRWDMPDATDRKKRGLWLATVDLPDDDSHPLLNAIRSTTRTPGEFRDCEWLAELPPAPIKNRAVAVYLEILKQQQPAMAAAWIDRLPPGMDREKAAGEIAASWAIADPDAAAAFLKAESPQMK